MILFLSLLFLLFLFLFLFLRSFFTGRRKEVPSRATKHSSDPQVHSHISSCFFFISFKYFFMILYIFYILSLCVPFIFYSLAVVDCLYCGIILPCNAVRLLGCWYRYLLKFFYQKLFCVFNSKIAPLVKTLIIFS